MFTIDDIKNIAVQIEENGEKTYREVAKETTDPQIAEMFNWMADEEKRHAQWFQNFKTDLPLTPEQIELAAMGKSLLQDMIKDQTFSLDKQALLDSRNLHEMLTQTVTFEQDTVLFYEFIGGLISDEKAFAQLQTIIEEEKGHAEKLEELATSVELYPV